VTADPTTQDGRTRALADGHRLPLLGLGVWQVPDGPDCVDAIRWALEAGYRHLDTAQAYRNEASVGTALRLGAVPWTTRASSKPGTASGMGWGQP
jgi:methylglyoxal/glyoxal reductase